MSRVVSPLELLLVGLLAIGLLLHVFMRPDYARRNLEYMPNMFETPGYEAQDPNPNFPDGKTLQAPVAGTVARGFLPRIDADGRFDTTTAWDKLAPGERARWDGMQPPFEFDRLEAQVQTALMARGKHVFDNVCATCHGPHGAGGTAVTKRGFPPPPRLQDPKFAAYTDGHLLHVITLGKGNMPAHANHVKRDDRWKLIRYVRTLLVTKP